MFIPTLPVIMKKTTLITFLLILILVNSSCKEELQPILETDFKIVEVDYAFDNYMNNTRDKSEPYLIKQRNIVFVEVDKNGQTTINNNFIEDSLISSELKKYIIPNPENDQMPITIEKEFEFSGKVTFNKNLIISAKYSKELDYEKYSGIRNKIYSSYNIVRNEFSKEKFSKTLEELISSNDESDNAKWNELRQIFPIHYTEIIEEK